MKNRIIIGVIIVLGGALLFENAYLLGRFNKERIYKAAYWRYRQAPRERFSERALPVVHESAYTVKVHMPGIAKKDINVQVKDEELIISAKSRKDQAVKGKDTYVQESSYGTFLSRFRLPEDTEKSRIVSDYQDGILTVTIPKKVKAKQEQGGRHGKTLPFKYRP
jgi:HSP20 family molecular chaperone IbpA